MTQKSLTFFDKETTAADYNKKPNYFTKKLFHYKNTIILKPVSPMLLLIFLVVVVENFGKNLLQDSNFPRLRFFYDCASPIDRFILSKKNKKN